MSSECLDAAAELTGGVVSVAQTWAMLSVAVGATARQDAQDVDGMGGLIAGEAHAPVTDPQPPFPLDARPSG
jgi:hypothetical protein